MYRLAIIALTLAVLVGSGCGVLSPPATAPTATVTPAPATALPLTPTPLPATATPTPLPATPTPRPSDAKPTPPPLVNPEGPKAGDTVVAQVVSVPGEEVGITAATFLDDTHGWLALGKVIMATTDGGQRWEERGQLTSKVNALDFTSADRGWAATETGLCTTGDGGAFWASIETVKAEPMSAVDFVDAEYGWVATDNNEFRRTTDGGVTWTVAASPCPANAGLGAFSFNDSERGWMLCGGVPGAGQQPKQLFKTADGGQHWDVVAGENPRPSPSTIPDSLPTAGYVSDLYFLDSELGWMTTSRGGLYRTADGGLTWERVAVGAAGEEFLRFPRFVSAEQGFVVSMQGRPALLGTRDGGDTWTQLYPGLWPVSAFDLVDGQYGFGAGTVQDPGAVLKTTNRGRNWKPVASFKGEEVLGFSLPDAEHGWVITERYQDGAIISRLYRTSDGGESWEKASETSALKELYPTDFGVGTLVESLRYPELVELGLNFMRGIGYRGIGSIEFKKDARDGKLKMIELNPRLWQQNSHATACGINLPLVQYRDLTEQTPAVQTEFLEGVKWLDAGADMLSFIEYHRSGQLSLVQWLATWRGTKVFPTFARDDPGPFLRSSQFGSKYVKLALYVLKCWR